MTELPKCVIADQVPIANKLHLKFGSSIVAMAGQTLKAPTGNISKMDEKPPFQQKHVFIMTKRITLSITFGQIRFCLNLFRWRMETM